MPNRILKESITTSATIDQLTTEAENLFYRLIVVVDDFGRMDARPPILRSNCFPLRIDRVTDEQITTWLLELEQAGLIRQYVVGEQPYLDIVTWARHQHIRAQRPRYPEPLDVGYQQPMAADIGYQQPMAADIGYQQPMAADIGCPRNPNPNPNPIDLSTSTSTSASTADEPAAPSAAAHPPIRSPVRRVRRDDAADYSEDFVSFWHEYPRKVSKHAAWLAWVKRLKGGARPEDLLAAARHLAIKVDRDQDELHYVWHAATFLGPERHYEDFIGGPPAPERRMRSPPNGPARGGRLAMVDDVLNAMRGNTRD